MKVKLLLTLLLFITSITTKAQETASTCEFEYAVDLKPTENVRYSSTFIWDISTINIQEIEISIEILPIKDCFNNEKALRFRELLTYDLKGVELAKKNNLEISLLKLSSKCFKWRIILKSTNCTEISEWNYYSFL